MGHNLPTNRQINDVMINQSKATARLFIIVGDYLNGCTLDKTISCLFPENAAIHVVSTSGRNMLPKLRRRNFTVFDPITDVTMDTLRKILSIYPTEAERYLLLTSEIWHEALWNDRQWLRDNNVVVHLGNIHPNAITQKTAFAKTVGIQLGYAVPTEYDVNELNKIQFPIMLKSSSSFSNGRRQVGKNIVGSLIDLKTVLATIAAEDRKNLIAQQLLNTSAENCISISGWYSRDTRVFLQTSKILQHPESMGNGDIVRTMQLNPTLAEMTNKICEAFDYHGPFELEFIRDHDKFFVLEMNPRFWMQHGLNESITGGRLLSLYCNASHTYAANEEITHWYNPLQGLLRILKLDFRPLKWLRKKTSCAPLSLQETIRWICIHYLKLPI